jgi:hypothetical protein
MTGVVMLKCDVEPRAGSAPRVNREFGSFVARRTLREALLTPSDERTFNTMLFDHKCCKRTHKRARVSDAGGTTLFRSKSLNKTDRQTKIVSRGELQRQ